MKRQQLWSFGVFLVFAAVLAPSTAWGVVRGFDSFNSYTVGDPLNGLSGGEGWAGPWFAEADVTIESKAISFGDQTGAPNAALLGGTDALQKMSRPFAPASETLYMGLLVRPEAWDDDFIQIQVSNGASGFNDPGLMTIGIDSRNAAGFFTRLGFAVTDFSDMAVFAPDEDYFLVGKFSKEAGSSTYNRIDMFVNPEGTSEPAVPDSTATGFDTMLSQLSLFTLRTALTEGPEMFFLDELRIATSFAEVTLSGSDLPDPGDFNADGTINLDDFDIMKNNFDEPGDFTAGDMNFSGFVDLHDFGLFVTAFNAANPAAVPEPGSGTLLGMGMVLGFFAWRRRLARLAGV